MAMASRSGHEVRIVAARARVLLAELAIVLYAGASETRRGCWSLVDGGEVSVLQTAMAGSVSSSSTETCDDCRPFSSSTN